MASTAFRITFTGERPPTLGALASILTEAAAGDRLACEFSIEQTDAGLAGTGGGVRGVRRRRPQLRRRRRRQLARPRLLGVRRRLELNRTAGWT
jgi:hypothetical protein